MISKRPCVRVCTLFFLLSLVGCDGSSGGGNDAGTDAGNDAGTDASTVDSGRDSGTPAQGPGNACNGPADCQTEGEVDTVGISCIGGHCGCATNADCEEGVCDPITSGCVGCATGGTCGGATPACVDNLCRECGAAADCANAFFGHVCNAFNVCGCNGPSDCAPGLGCRDGACDIGCTSDAQCQDGWSSVCDPSTALCVVCVENADCAANGMSTSGYGSVCLENRTCGCNTSNDCVGNAFGTQCINGICDAP